MASPGNVSPRLAGVFYVGNGAPLTLVLTFHYNGVHFQVVAASPKDEAGGEALLHPLYKFGESIEGKILTELDALSWGEFDEARDEASERLENQLAELAAEACRPAMQQLAPNLIPDAHTLEQYLYPQTHTLQILTDFGCGRLTCRPLDGYTIPESHPPISEDRLHTMGFSLETTDIPIVKVSQVILVRRLQGLVWKVAVDGKDGKDREEMICKASIDVFHHPLADELETYLKIRSAKAEFRVPELKGTPLPIYFLYTHLTTLQLTMSRNRGVSQGRGWYPPRLHPTRAPQSTRSAGRCRRRCHPTRGGDRVPQAQVGNADPGDPTGSAQPRNPLARHQD